MIFLEVLWLNLWLFNLWIFRIYHTTKPRDTSKSHAPSVPWHFLVNLSKKQVIHYIMIRKTDSWTPPPLPLSMPKLHTPLVTFLVVLLCRKKIQLRENKLRMQNEERKKTILNLIYTFSLISFSNTWRLTNFFQLLRQKQKWLIGLESRARFGF